MKRINRDENGPADEEVHVDLMEVEKEAMDVLEGLGEVALDSFLADGPVRDIPVLGTVLKFFRGAKALRDLIFVRKLTEFVRNAPNVDPKKKEKFRQTLLTDHEFARRTATHLTVVLERFDEMEKAALLARIFGAYIEGAIDQQQMRRLAAILDRTLLADLMALKDFVRDQKPLSHENYYGLEGVGLAFAYHSIVRPVEPGQLQGQVGTTHFILSPSAVKLVEVAF